jgi:hypothetical protein
MSQLSASTVGHRFTKKTEDKEESKKTTAGQENMAKTE